MIIDTHCHLDDARYQEDVEEVIEEAKRHGVQKYIIPGADPSTLQRAVEIADRYEGVYFSVGVHPYDAKVYDRSFLEPFVTHPKCVAIGECGLDYFRLPKEAEAIEEEKRLQKEVFIDQVKWARSLDLPLIVHIREASLDALEILKMHAGDQGGVLHCYNAHPSLLELASLNFYYGIGGVVTFKNAKKLIEIYPKIPQERLLLETDAPYLTPTPHRGKRNQPSYTTHIAQKMAQLSNVAYREIEAVTTSNAQRLFGI
jgi:TatD DNase family protein